MAHPTPTAGTKPDAVGAPTTNGVKGPLPDDSFDNTDSKLARSNADEKRKEQWKNRLYALSILDGRRERWARRVVTAAAYSNANRDPEKAPPRLTFTGAAAVDAGATDHEMHALPRLSPDEIASLRIDAAAVREHTRQQIRRRASALATARPALSAVIRLAKDMVSDPPAGVIVDKLLYEKTVTSWLATAAHSRRSRCWRWRAQRQPVATSPVACGCPSGTPCCTCAQNTAGITSSATSGLGARPTRSMSRAWRYTVWMTWCSSATTVTWLS